MVCFGIRRNVVWWFKVYSMISSLSVTEPCASGESRIQVTKCLRNAFLISIVTSLDQKSGAESVKDALHKTQKWKWSSQLTKHFILKLEAVAGDGTLFLYDGGRLRGGATGLNLQLLLQVINLLIAQALRLKPNDKVHAHWRKGMKTLRWTYPVFLLFLLVYILPPQDSRNKTLRKINHQQHPKLTLRKQWPLRGTYDNKTIIKHYNSVMLE